MDLQERIAAFVSHVDAVAAEYWQNSNFTHSRPPIHKADYISDKWCRIDVLDDRNGVYAPTSVYCFVCLQDYTTKTLGQLKAGDIHKAASYKAAAKHARGTVFAEDFGKCAGPHGVAYLK